MGNTTRPDPDRHNVTPRTILPREPRGGIGPSGGEVPRPSWQITLEDLTPAAEALRVGVAVRGEQAEPRIRVYAGQNLLGFVPIAKSAEIREAMREGAAILLGKVVSVDLQTRRVVVRLRLEDR